MNGVRNGVFLLRSQFLNWDIDGATTQLMALLWQHWFEAARFHQEGAAHGHLEARLWGAPRAQLPALMEQLRPLFGDLNPIEIKLADADTISIHSAAQPLMPIAREKPYAARRLWHQLWQRRDENEIANRMRQWTEALSSCAALQGLTLMLRLDIGQSEGASTQRMQSTLVLFGRLTRGTFALQGVWPGGGSNNGLNETIYRSTVWPQEADFVRDVRRLQHDARFLSDAATPISLPAAPLPATNSSATEDEEGAPSAWGEQIFQMSRPNLMVKAIMFFVAFDWKIGPFLLRLILSLLIVVISAFLWWRIPRANLFAGVIGVYGVWATQHLVRTSVGRVCAVRRGMKAAFQKLYTQPSRFVPIAAQECEEPSLSKFARDIESLGGRAIMDLRTEPGPLGRTLTRAFLMDDGATNFMLLLQSDNGQFRNSPALPNFLVTTYFSDGGRLVSTSGPSGYTKPSPLAAPSKCGTARIEKRARAGQVHGEHRTRRARRGVMPTLEPRTR